MVTPQDWHLVRMWGAWRQLGGMPSRGAVEDQDARLIEALAILENEQDMIAAAAQEEAMRRARSRS